MTPLRRVNDYLSLVKFSHTIFALPFALLGFFLATLDAGELRPLTLLLVVLCMVFARSAAMGFNRYLDRDIDSRNARTAVREIPAGTISARSALVFVAVNCLLFIGAAGLLNPLCLALSPVALLVILGYSYTKRFTYLCHFVLGLGLALAPIGAYLAVTAEWAVLPVLYGAIVLLWVSGFDIVYALQDEEFDREEQLYSIPVRLGTRGALRLGRMLHLLCAVIVVLAVLRQQTVYPEVGGLTWVAGGIFLSLLAYQHTVVRADDLSRINLAFFTTNGIASLIFGGLSVLDMYV
ncbi:4-hydroxybenzoate polyprenyltransferase [Lewinella marina]|uniref:4-hydroxybenzoate octaprenyltransferase n=1 Tax=Neolewinella marina TaxID=438751 RepID=A0A2G0CIT5_9BACT|nr:UbiA-like polyprenyltransferase [Neolewinella marina]NJB84955.1 4-hydroxybenzoate polyprenyltransferase [Neolewinella marina]PHK99892.1 4-hydroxybenzoate octaprenyltransferase [Neolewinella marina]